VTDPALGSKQIKAEIEKHYQRSRSSFELERLLFDVTPGATGRPSLDVVAFHSLDSNRLILL
jgi:hypothetical protein